MKVWNCKGYKPFMVKDSRGNLLVSGRTMYKFGIPYVTIIGGLGGPGIADYSEKLLKEILNRYRVRKLVIYDFHERPILEKYGFRKYIDYTFIIDISNINELWRKLNKKNRNAIRFAEKSGVCFETLEKLEQINEIYHLFIEQAKRYNFKIPRKDYFENVWKEMKVKGKAEFFVASLKGNPLSVAVTFMHEDVISMPIWGNINEARKFKANNYLIWKILEYASRHGYKKFNFWGTDPNPNSPFYGIHKFKESFGGELVKVYRYEKSNFIYNLFRFIYNLSKKYTNIPLYRLH